MQKSQGAEATVICSSLRAMDGAASGPREGFMPVRQVTVTSATRLPLQAIPVTEARGEIEIEL
ncbi:hypothetical protein CRX72_23015 [Pantoea sp. BRM17]|nr:hypothetical protein CRX72_23015 [Pantoea sp. BRM17]